MLGNFKPILWNCCWYFLFFTKANTSEIRLKSPTSHTKTGTTCILDFEDKCPFKPNPQTIIILQTQQHKKRVEPITFSELPLPIAAHSYCLYSVTCHWGWRNVSVTALLTSTQLDEEQHIKHVGTTKKLQHGCWYWMVMKKQDYVLWQLSMYSFSVYILWQPVDSSAHDNYSMVNVKFIF